ncbi:fimbria/pilus outer membrane usher protein [Providencia stuartii]|uniref:fimbria/pilus outer membrane usher protein n=1 Tax=Providencia stuartii TaxID=588 RepID=UPI0024B1EC92
MKKYTPTAIAIWFNIQPVMAADKTNFDEEFLRSRGIDVAIAAQLAKAPAFLPGKQEIKIYINNQFRVNTEVDINEQGEPCINSKLLETIGLENRLLLSGENDCLDIRQLWKNGEIVQRPKKQELWFFVPESVVLINYNEKTNYTYGGNGAIVNYSTNYMGGSGSNNDMYYINTEAGINTGNWLLRSYQIYNHLSESDFIHQYAYAQTTLEKQKKNLQIGQINLNNSVIGASRVIGLQLFPENQLETNHSSGAIVSGIAAESSMVEIYQSGRLIYNTAVPAGPFELSQFSLVNRTADLHVKLKGVNGSEQSFIVPSTTFSNFSTHYNTGYSFGIGRYDEPHADNKPFIISLSKGWGISHHWGVQAGTVLSTDYYSLGLNNAIKLSPNTFLAFNTDFSHDNNHASTGTLFSGSLSYLLSEQVSIGANTLVQSKNYHYLSDATRKNENDINNRQKQLGSDINWATEIGTLSSSVGRTYTQDNKSQDYISFSWSQAFSENITLNTSYQRTYNIDNVYEDTVFLRLSIPLDRANISSWVTHANNSNRWGARYNNYVDRDRNWGIAYEYNDKQHYQSVSANLHTVTPYAQLGGNIRRDNEQQTSWGASLTGGVALVNEGILLSPYEIKETFGIAKAGDRRYVRIDTGAGPTWTNGNGYSVIPNLNAYQQNAIKVDPRSLSRQSDILNAYKTITPAKGSVVPVHFTVIESRRVRIKANFSGKPLPQNSVIRDEAGNFLTLSTQSGQFFLGQAIPNMKLIVETPEKKFCGIKLVLPNEPKEQVLYEEVNVQCH